VPLLVDLFGAAVGLAPHLLHLVALLYFRFY
jgi:hypothetical protein